MYRQPGEYVIYLYENYYTFFADIKFRKYKYTENNLNLFISASQIGDKMELYMEKKNETTTNCP
jgi:hypothetical protein